MQFLSLSLLVLATCANQLGIRGGLSEAATILCGDRVASFTQPEDVAKSIDATTASEATITTTSEAPTTQPSEVKQFFNRVQCTLERARPWVEELEKEAKRLEQTVLHIGEGVMNTVNTLVKGLIVNNEPSNSKSIFGVLLRGMMPHRSAHTTVTTTTESPLSHIDHEESEEDDNASIIPDNVPQSSTTTAAPTPTVSTTVGVASTRSSSSSSSTTTTTMRTAAADLAEPADGNADDSEFMDNEI